MSPPPPPTKSSSRRPIPCTSMSSAGRNGPTPHQTHTHALPLVIKATASKSNKINPRSHSTMQGVSHRPIQIQLELNSKISHPLHKRETTKNSILKRRPSGSCFHCASTAFTFKKKKKKQDGSRCRYKVKHLHLTRLPATCKHKTQVSGVARLPVTTSRSLANFFSSASSSTCLVTCVFL